jgi:hypothetical protein
MENRGILHHWIVPQLGLNGGTLFAGTPVGNAPEGMPWDCVLNNCLAIAVMRHVSATAHSPNLDPRKSNLKTPDDIAKACQRVPAAGIPSASRIKTDVLKVLWLARSMVKVCSRRTKMACRQACSGSWPDHSPDHLAALPPTTFVRNSMSSAFCHRRCPILDSCP